MQTTTATRWERICSDPSLQDLPYKVETNAHGQIVLSPHTQRHSVIQGAIMDLLYELVERPGHRAVEYPVETPEGTKVPDIVWISRERYGQVPAESADSSVMPELCVEVLSNSNLQSEIDEKRRLYFDGGAEEVWIVSEDGEVACYGRNGRIEKSRLVEGLPTRVEV